MVVVLSPCHLQDADPLDSYILSVGNGNFTMDADRSRVQPFLQAMIGNKLKTFSSPSCHDYRFLNCLKHIILGGLPCTRERSLTPNKVARFLEANGYDASSVSSETQ